VRPREWVSECLADVATDGRRFVAVKAITRPERHALVIENWLAKVRAGR
jgi:hypothetical protein